MRIPTLIVTTLLLVGCAQTPREEEVPPTPPAPGPRPESEQWDAVIRLFETGRIRSVIEAGYLAVYSLPEREFTRLDTVDADFYDEDGERSSHLVADAGEIQDQQREGRRRVKTWGDVYLVGREGQTVRADTLWWDEAQDRVYTDGPVEVTEEGDVLRGIGFESDTELTEMRILNASGTSLRAGRWLEDEREGDRRSSAGPDSAAARPDTTGAIPDTATAVPDTTAAPPAQHIIPPEQRASGSGDPTRRVRRR